MSLLRTSLLLGLASLGMLAACGSPGGSGTDAVRDVDGESVGVVEQLGEQLPRGMQFVDEEGNEVDLVASLDKPTILTLVYFRCPKICNQVLNEVANTIDEVTKIKPGTAYDLVTVSFDPREGPDLARTGKTNLLERMKTKVPEDAWHFLTGDEANIRKLTEAVGFKYKQDENGDYIHAGAVIFVTKDGKIVRYLGGLVIHPFDLEMAVNDASAGTPRSFMQRVQQICYSYDPEGKAYTLNFVQITMFVTLLFLGLFVAFLLLRRKKTPTDPYKPSTASQAMEGGSV